MYQPPHFQEDRPEILQGLMRSHPFASLIAIGKEGLLANHFPLFLQVDDAGYGALQGHMAKANPLWSDYDPGSDVVAIFQGPQAYVTPSWYPSKTEHGKVVPTWNYAVVHAHGRLTVKDDADWLRAHLDALTATQEAGREAPWASTDAPAEFIEKQLKGIVGFEIAISRLEGKWKMSQNRAETDRLGVVSGLRAEGTEQAAEVARNVARGTAD